MASSASPSRFILPGAPPSAQHGDSLLDDSAGVVVSAQVVLATPGIETLTFERSLNRVAPAATLLSSRAVAATLPLRPECATPLEFEMRFRQAATDAGVEPESIEAAVTMAKQAFSAAHDVVAKTHPHNCEYGPWAGQAASQCYVGIYLGVLSNNKSIERDYRAKYAALITSGTAQPLASKKSAKAISDSRIRSLMPFYCGFLPHNFLLPDHCPTAGSHFYPAIALEVANCARSVLLARLAKERFEDACPGQEDGQASIRDVQLNALILRMNAVGRMAHGILQGAYSDALFLGVAPEQAIELCHRIAAVISIIYTYVQEKHNTYTYVQERHNTANEDDDALSISIETMAAIIGNFKEFLDNRLAMEVVYESYQAIGDVLPKVCEIVFLNTSGIPDILRCGRRILAINEVIQAFIDVYIDARAAGASAEDASAAGRAAIFTFLSFFDAVSNAYSAYQSYSGMPPISVAIAVGALSAVACRNTLALTTPFAWHNCQIGAAAFRAVYCAVHHFMGGWAWVFKDDRYKIVIELATQLSSSLARHGALAPFLADVLADIYEVTATRINADTLNSSLAAGNAALMETTETTIPHIIALCESVRAEHGDEWATYAAWTFSVAFHEQRMFEREAALDAGEKEIEILARKLASGVYGCDQGSKKLAAQRLLAEIDDQLLRHL